MVYVDNAAVVAEYIKREQPTTKLDLTQRVRYYDPANLALTEPLNDLVLRFSQKDFMHNGNEASGILMSLTDILEDGVEDHSVIELGPFKLTSRVVKDIASTLIKI